MGEVKISALGGCHVAGYPYEVKQAFPSLLAMQTEGQVVERMAHLQFVKMPSHLPAIDALHPSHVLLQLGNYEFCASASSLYKQARRSLGLKATGKKNSKGTSSSKSTSDSDSSYDSMPRARSATFLNKLLAKPGLYVRVAVLGLFISVLWLCSPQHRRAFRALNACMRQHPATAFLFLSPFPHLDPAVNTLRRLGGWIMRRGVASTTNCHWVDSHQLIQRDLPLFYDSGHLNEEGHRYIAAFLAKNFF
jgi:hypothetical protein